MRESGEESISSPAASPGQGLHRRLFQANLKWDAGIGRRFMMRHAVVRFDAAYSDETAGVWFFAGQPF